MSRSRSRCDNGHQAQLDIMDNPLASAALSASKEGGTGHWDDIEGQQSRLKDPGYYNRKVAAPAANRYRGSAPRGPVGSDPLQTAQ